VIVQGAVFAALGLALAYLGAGPSATGPSLDADELLGPALFWYAVVLLLLSFPLRGAASTCRRALATRLGALVFWPYLLVHLLLYAFLVEAIIGSLYGVTFALSPTLTVTTNAFMPRSAVSTLLDLAYNPSVAFTAPPVLSGDVTAYAVAIAALVDVLILANVAKTVELGRLCNAARRARAFFVLPAVGVVLGASCCLSVPALISLASPSVVSNSQFLWVYSASYYLLPPFAVIVLVLNLISVDRIAETLRGSPGRGPSPDQSSSSAPSSSASAGAALECAGGGERARPRIS